MHPCILHSHLYQLVGMLAPMWPEKLITVSDKVPCIGLCYIIKYVSQTKEPCMQQYPVRLIKLNHQLNKVFIINYVDRIEATSMDTGWFIRRLCRNFFRNMKQHSKQVSILLCFTYNLKNKCINFVVYKTLFITWFHSSRSTYSLLSVWLYPTHLNKKLKPFFSFVTIHCVHQRENFRTKHWCK